MEIRGEREREGVYGQRRVRGRRTEKEIDRDSRKKKKKRE